MTQPRTVGFLPNLNGLRFFAALSVCLFHCFTLQREYWENISSNTFGKLCYKLISHGHLGVNLFFVLSGFLITYRLILEHNETGRINALQFLLRRTLRIWPLYFVVVIFGFYLFPILPFGFETKHSLLHYSFFFANLDELRIGLYDANNSLTTLWSVSIEEQFYLGLFLLLLLFHRQIKLSFLCLFTAVLIYCCYFRTLNVHNERILYYHTFSVISDIAIGGLGALMIQKNALRAFFEHLQSVKLIVLYTLIGICLALSIAIDHPYLLPYTRIVQACCFLFLILEQSISKKHLFQFDSFPGFNYLGKRTYGFYLFHCIVLYYSNQLLLSIGLTNSFSGFMAHLVVVLCLTTLLSILSYRFIESPIIQIKK